MRTRSSILFLFISILLFACGQQPPVSPNPIPPASTLLPPTMTLPTDTPTLITEVLPNFEAQRMENNDPVYALLEDTGLRYGEDVDVLPVIYDIGNNAQMAIGQKSEGEYNKYLVYVNYGDGKWLGLQVLSMENADLGNTNELVFGEDDDSGALLTLTTTRSGKVIGLLNSKADLDNSVEFFMASDIPSFFELQDDGQLKIGEAIEFEVLRNEFELDLSWLRTREDGEDVLPAGYKFNDIVVGNGESGVYSDESLGSYLAVTDYRSDGFVNSEVKVGNIAVSNEAKAELFYEAAWGAYSIKGGFSRQDALSEEEWRDATIRMQNGEAKERDITNLIVGFSEYETGREIPVIFFPGENMNLPESVISLDNIKIHIVNGKADEIKDHVMHKPGTPTTTWAAYIDANNASLVIVLGMEYIYDNASYNTTETRKVLIKNLSRIPMNLGLWDGKCDQFQISEEKCYWKGAYPPDPGSRNVYDKQLFKVLNPNLSVEISKRTIK